MSSNRLSKYLGLGTIAALGLTGCSKSDQTFEQKLAQSARPQVLAIETALVNKGLMTPIGIAVIDYDIGKSTRGTARTVSDSKGMFHTVNQETDNKIKTNVYVSYDYEPAQPVKGRLLNPQGYDVFTVDITRSNDKFVGNGYFEKTVASVKFRRSVDEAYQVGNLNRFNTNLPNYTLDANISNVTVSVVDPKYKVFATNIAETVNGATKIGYCNLPKLGNLADGIKDISFN